MAETQNTGQFAKTIVTDVGKDMIAKSQNGQTLTFSRVALGDGLVGEEEDVTKFTAVKNERLSLPIAKYSNLGNGQFQIQFRLTNSQVESGFWHREIGIMAKIDNGQEQLYPYTTAGNKASFIYDKTTPVEERIVNVNFVIGNAQNLKVIINSSVIYATIEDLEEALDAHDAGADAHEPAFDAHNAADDAHKDFTGATAEAAGKRGMVPAPAAGDQNKALFGNGTYKQVVQKVNGVAPDSGGNVTVPIYTNSKQIGLNDRTFTWEQLYDALPNNSMLVCSVNPTSASPLYNPNLDLPNAGTLNVVKGSGSGYGMQIILIPSSVSNSLNINWATFANETFSGWKQMATTDMIPVGTILPFAGGTIPSGFLACNGAGLSATTYAKLYAVIGNTYGGNSTTFNLPQIEDNRFLEFSSTRGTKKNAGLPNITGQLDTGRETPLFYAARITGAFSPNGSTNLNFGTAGGSVATADRCYQISFDASRSSTVYGDSTTVQPKSLTVRAIIKY